MNTLNTWFIFTLFACIAIQTVSANNKVVAYWGQNSVGNEETLSYYCESASVDIIVVGFVYEFPTASGSTYPGINLANHCYETFDAADPYFLNCADSVGPDITYCQSIGKEIILSFGGAVGTYGFTSDSQAKTFATTVWNMFLGGTSTTRPFGTAIFDGIDLDIEGGSTTGYAAFITQLRTYFTAQSSRTYTISGAPQCVYPDALLGPGTGTALTEAWFDYVWVQFYNNYCGVNYYPSEFNFNTWANWATTISVNPNVQVFIGAPASSSSAGQGYVSAATLKIIATAIDALYANYGGIMLWDVGTALANNDFATQLAAFVHVASSPSQTATQSTTGAKIAAQSTTGVAKTASKSTTGAATAKTASTTGAVKTASKSTTGAAKTATQSTTGRVSSKVSTTGQVSSKVATTGAVSAPTSVISTPSSTESSCTLGYMRCDSSSTYQMCGNSGWAATQSCPTGLTCTPWASNSNYIYCS